MIWSLDVIVYQYTYIIKQLAAMHFWRHQLTVSLPLCSWTCSSSLCVITVSTVRLQTVQFVQYLYSICAVLLCSWSCSRSLCVITVSTVQLQTVQFVQYLYSKCAVLLCNWSCSSSLCVITVSTVQLSCRLYSLYSICTANVLYNRLRHLTWQALCPSVSPTNNNIHSLCDCLG